MRFAALFFALLFAFGLSAGSKFTRFLVKMDSVMAAKYYKVNYDTNYIGRPKFRWVLRSRFNLSGHDLLARGEQLADAQGRCIFRRKQMDRAPGIRRAAAKHSV